MRRCARQYSVMASHCLAIWCNRNSLSWTYGCLEHHPDSCDAIRVGDHRKPINHESCIVEWSHQHGPVRLEINSLIRQRVEIPIEQLDRKRGVND